jgi:hypothetical protein
MLKKPANIVLASLRGSTYRSVRLASLIAAALLNGLFEHPATIQALSPYPLSIAASPSHKTEGFDTCEKPVELLPWALPY